MLGYRRFAGFVRPSRFLFPSLALLLTGCNRGYGGYGNRTEIGPTLISIAAGAVVGAFFSQRMKPYRKYVWYALLAAFVIAALNSGPPQAYFMWFLVAAVATWLALRVKAALAGKRPKPTTFGSAEWADLEHVQKAGLIGDKGYWLGWFVSENQRHPLTYTGDRHLLTVAPTRAGKGVSAIVPNLLAYKGSALVIDPKGENARITATRRGAGDPARNITGLGQTVHVVDPWSITDFQASGFNPLDWLDSDDPDIGENAFMLADAMVIRAGRGDSAFWDDESVALLWGFILYVALEIPRGPERTLGKVRDLLSQNEDEMTAFLKDTMYPHDNDIISGTASRTLGKDEKTRANVFASVQAQTHFLDSPRIRESLASSDFQFEDLKTGLVTVYLVLPADRLTTFGRWLRLLIQQAITVNARNIEVKPERPILFLLDEMAALGKLTKVEEAFGLMAGFGMQMWGIVQDLSQLDRIYDKGWETFIGNSGVLQYFGSRDHKTAEYFSKLCGVSTIEKASITRAFTRVFGGQGGSSSTDSSTIDVIQRQLAFPDELMIMRKGQELLLIENHNPINAQRITWYQDDRLRQLGVNLQSGSTVPNLTSHPASPPLSAAPARPVETIHPGASLPVA